MNRVMFFTGKPRRIQLGKPASSKGHGEQDEDDDPTYMDVDVDSGNLADTERARHGDTPSNRCLHSHTTHADDPLPLGHVLPQQMEAISGMIPATIIR